MTTLDLVIRGGCVIDGTGRGGRLADLGVHDGRIVELGEVEGTSATAIDASGLVVTPGFVDIHTHYDAQAFWDPDLAPSVQHGVTTVVAGNCGFTLAPIGPEHVDYLLRLLARVEGIPLETLERGVECTWSSFGEYLDRVDGTLAVNAGFLVGHSAIRRVVMGEDAVGGVASENQIEAMRAQLDRALYAGALGFSSSNARTHHDGAGDPVPSRFADDREMLALCEVLAGYPGTSLEYIPATAADEADHMTAMSLAAGRPLNWNVLVVVASRREAYERDLAASDRARASGATVAALTLPMLMEMRLTLRSGFMLDSLPGWQEVMKLAVPERCAALRDPAVRDRLRRGAIDAGPRRAELTDWSSHLICETRAEENAGLAGRTVGDVARERGADAFDTLLDVSLADDLGTVVLPPASGRDDESWAQRARLWRDPRVILGASDAGAHLDMLTAFTYPTQVLGEAVRERELLSLEEAVHLMSDRPARFYGLRERGRIELGWRADLLVIDPSRIAPGPVHTRRDLPGGAARLCAAGEGIEHVIINGTRVADRGNLTGNRPGTLLRAGRDTDTLTIPGKP